MSLPHLLVTALALGAAALVPFSGFTAPMAAVLVPSLIAFAALAWFERSHAHATANARQAAAFLGSLRLGAKGGVGGVPALGLAMWLVGVAVVCGVVAAPLVPLLAIAGVGVYEWAYVRAGQLPPLS
jgi:hypothetical protein